MKNACIRILLPLVFLSTFITGVLAQEFANWEAFAQYYSGQCSCPVTIYETYEDYSRGTPSSTYNNGQQTYPGNSFWNETYGYTSKATGYYYSPVDPGFKNDPQNATTNCYSCECDPLFCIGDGSDAHQAKDYESYGIPPCRSCACDPYYCTWNWTPGTPAPTNPYEFNQYIQQNPNGDGYYFRIIYGTKYAFKVKNGQITQNNYITEISPPCNYLEEGRQNARINAACPPIWHFSTEDGRWYYRNHEMDKQWRLFVPDESILDGFTEQTFIQYITDHPVESEQLYASVMNGGPFGLLPPTPANLAISTFILEKVNEEVRALEIINERDNKGWSKYGILARAYWNLLKGSGHFFLDVVGMAPVVGEAADIINGVWYTIEGDAVNATLSYAGAVPVVGWFSTAGKWIGKAVKLSDGTVTFLKLSKRSDGIFEFGGELRNSLNITDKTLHAHHVVPWQFREHQVVQAAAQKGFHMNDFINGVPLKKYTKIEFPDGVHQHHPAYNKYVEKKLQDYLEGNSNFTPNDAKNFLTNELLPELKSHLDEVKDYSGNLNDYFRDVVNPSAGIQ